MGTEKKSKSGSELPKGSAAPSCKLSALCLPRALLLSGGGPKGLLSSPRAGFCLWASQGHPITPVPPPLPPPSAAAPVEGAAWKGKLAPRSTLPLPEGRRGGRQPGQGPGGLGAPSWPCPAAVEGTTAAGDPQEEEEGAARRAWGHPLAWHLSGAARGLCRGHWQGHGSRPGSLWPALARGVLTVPRPGRERFQGRLGGLTVPLHGCSLADATQGGSGQI